MFKVVNISGQSLQVLIKKDGKEIYTTLTAGPANNPVISEEVTSHIDTLKKRSLVSVIPIKSVD